MGEFTSGSASQRLLSLVGRVVAVQLRDIQAACSRSSATVGAPGTKYGLVVEAQLGLPLVVLAEAVSELVGISSV